MDSETEEVKQYEVVIYVVPWEDSYELQSVRDITASILSGDLYENDALRQEVLTFAESQIRQRANRDLSNYVISGF
jgi:hypothetical protein